MVEGWRLLIVENAPILTGRSARRSGAMFLLKHGYSIDAIKFLGRWASDAMAAYLNEARQHIPIDVAGDLRASKGGAMVIPFAASAQVELAHALPE
eukprot:2707795-Amphidinium_carterae.1